MEAPFSQTMQDNKSKIWIDLASIDDGLEQLLGAWRGNPAVVGWLDYKLKAKKIGWLQLSC